MPTRMIIALWLWLLPIWAQASEIRALLVGVAAYPDGGSIQRLNGPVNDVNAMDGLLRSRFGLDDRSIKTLIDSQATHDAILTQIESYLGAAATGDTAIFYFSGHGSWQIDKNGDEDDGVDETIIPFDGRSGGAVRDISDDVLGRAITRLIDSGINVVVILDACNSGTGLRSSMTEKRAPPADPTLGEPASRSWGRLAPENRRQPVFIAAAPADGWAYESGPTPETTYGNFTREFIAVVGGPVLSYREALSRVDMRLSKYGNRQKTVSEGPRDGAVFGSTFDAPHAILTGKRSGSGFLVRAGAMLGLDPGTVFEGYVTALQAADAAPGQGFPTKVAKLTQDFAILDVETTDNLPETAYFVLRSRSFSDEQLRVWADGPLRDTLHAIATEKAHILMVMNEASADVRFVHGLGSVSILSADGTPFLGSTLGLGSDKEAMAAYLDKLTQYFGFFRRSNDSADLQLEARVVVTNAAGTSRLPSMIGEETGLSVGQDFQLCVVNKSPLDAVHVYAYALNGPTSESDAWILLADPRRGLPGTKLAPNTGAVLASRLRPNGPGKMVLRLIATTSPITAPKLLELRLSDVRSNARDGCEDIVMELAAALCDVTKPKVLHPSKWETLDIPIRIFESDRPRGSNAPPCEP